MILKAMSVHMILQHGKASRDLTKYPRRSIFLMGSCIKSIYHSEVPGEELLLLMLGDSRAAATTCSKYRFVTCLGYATSMLREGRNSLYHEASEHQKGCSKTRIFFTVEIIATPMAEADDDGLHNSTMTRYGFGDMHGSGTLNAQFLESLFMRDSSSI